jgi:cytochrome c oxidase subunit 2
MLTPLKATARLASGALAAGGLAGCAGPQSALDPAGRDAAQIADLFIWMVVGAAVVWLVVIGLAIYATLHRAADGDRKRVRLFIIGGGALFPTVVLTGLLMYGLSLLPDLLTDGSADGPQIEVVGEQWWWRVRYQLPDGRRFELANELWLPVGERVPVTLLTADVIHAFWVPALAGKIDMVPGRINKMALHPTRTGLFRGACAEYCGLSHARMAFHARVVERAEFEAWADLQAAPARAPVDAPGAQLFMSLGCGACHTVRGTEARGMVGPDLTHVGSRVSLGAAVLPNDVEAFRRWLEELDRLKPGVHMPAFRMLPEHERLTLAQWLEGLQ